MSTIREALRRCLRDAKYRVTDIYDAGAGYLHRARYGYNKDDLFNFDVYLVELLIRVLPQMKSEWVYEEHRDDLDEWMQGLYDNKVKKNEDIDTIVCTLVEYLNGDPYFPEEGQLEPVVEAFGLLGQQLPALWK